MAPDLVAVHAAFASPVKIVTERRSLYRLAARLVGVPGTVPDDVLDSPLVRYHLGGALAGQIDLTGRDLTIDRDAIGRVAHAGLPVVADPVAQVALTDLLRIVGPVEGLRLCTTADRVFDQVLDVVSAGVQMVREVGGTLAADLLTHVDLIAVVDPTSAGGLVSASSRYFPGVVVIERPSTAMEVAEALVHEGAHEKFFDLAMTRAFFGVESDRVEEFVPSWSAARWPFEQVYAAWHAYLCLAQYARGLDGANFGANSLLPHAAERMREIGSWLSCRETSLRSDARWMLSRFVGLPASKGVIPPSVEDCVKEGKFVLNPIVSLGDPSPTGRRVVGLARATPELFWLETGPCRVLNLFVECVDGLSFEDVLILAEESAGDDAGNVRVELSVAMDFLLGSRLIVPAAGGTHL